MIKIFEGADATGKTTAAQRLSNLYAAKYLHAGAPSRATWKQEYVEPLRDAGDVVIDRWHLGELVWPEVFGRPSLFRDDAEFVECCRALGDLGAELFVVFRDEESILATLRERGELDTADGVIAGQRLFMDKVALVKGMPVSVVSSDALYGGALWS